MNAQATDTFNQRVQTALGFSGRQLRHLITQHPDLFSLYTVDGKWKHDSEAWTNWCEGFLGGMLWIIYRHTKEAWWQERAEHYSQLIEHRKSDRNAFVILNTLLNPEFLANETPGWEGILRHGIYHERKKLGVDESVMWGEYFFLSALDKALRLAH